MNPCNHSANPDHYPHTLAREGDIVFLITDREGTVSRKPLGHDPAIRTVYTRWEHLMLEHTRHDANVFLWGALSGMEVTFIRDAFGERTIDRIGQVGRMLRP